MQPRGGWTVSRATSCCLRDRSLHGPSNFRVRLLVGCDGLELDASRFRYRTNQNISPGDATCNKEEESPSHFLVSCSALSPRRNELLQDAPACVQAHLPHDSEASTSTLCSLLDPAGTRVAACCTCARVAPIFLRQTRAELLSPHWIKLHPLTE